MNKQRNSIKSKTLGLIQAIIGGRLGLIFILALTGIPIAEHRLCAQQVIYGNNAGSDPDVAEQFDRDTGALLQSYTVSAGNGRGVVVLGNTMYSTVAGDSKIYVTDVTTGLPLGIIPTEVPSMSTLAWDGSHFWTTDYSGSNQGYELDVSGNIVKTITFPLASKFMDGMEYFNGKLIVNRCDACGEYDIYDLDGNVQVANFINTGTQSTGIAFDGQNFFVSDIFLSRLSVWDGGSGAFIKYVPLPDPSQSSQGRLIEDLSLDYTTRPDTDGSFTLTPATAENPVGTTHTVTATLTEVPAGPSISDATVTFTVTSGPNAGELGIGVTDANGQATFTYTDLGGFGTDTIIATVDGNGVTKTANAIKIWIPPCAYDLSVEVGYEWGGSGDSLIYDANPDSGFVIIRNNGPATFLGELRLDGVAGTGGDVHDTSGPGYALAPGDSFRLEAGPESSDQGGFNKVINVCSSGCSTPDNGLLLSISGTAASFSIRFEIFDKDIHSGAFQVNPHGITLDNYILQGGDPCGRDTGDDFELNQAHAMFHVRGSCIKPCRLTCPSDITVCNQKGQCGAVVHYAGPNLAGDCEAGATQACSPASGFFFPLGSTTVYCTNTAGGRVVAECSFHVTVTDNEPTTINCPANITRCNDPGQCGAVIFFSPIAADNCSSNPAVVCSSPSGSFFPTGTTTVLCRAPGPTNNAPSCSFTVTVRDCELPRITCPAPMTQCNDSGQCGAVVAFSPSARDNCPGLTTSCSPASGSVFPTGTTTVTCTATDNSGRRATCKFDVTVQDCEPPTAGCTPTTNPAGGNVPNAGAGQGSSPKSGQNPDGFYELQGTDNCGAAGVSLFVKDSAEGPCGGAFMAGPYPPGTQVKLTQSPGQRSVKPMAGVITAHINTQGEPLIVAIDASGNTAVCTTCFVPPPPK